MPTTVADGAQRRWPPDLSAIPTLTTDRLTLRFHRPDDAVAVCGIADDWEVARYTARIPHPYELHMAETWIAEGRGLRDAGRELGYAIVRRSDGSLIGGVSLTFGQDIGEAEIGFSMGRAYWGNGYMREAVAAVLSAAFEVLKLETVWADTVPENTRSAALQKALGFQTVERREAEASARGGTITVDVRRLTAAGWQDRPSKGEGG